MGKGGLYRAYGGCARDQLQATIASGHKVVHVPTCTVEVVVSTADLGMFYHVLMKHQCRQLSCQTDEAGGTTTLTYCVPVSQHDVIANLWLQHKDLRVKCSIVGGDGAS